MGEEIGDGGELFTGLRDAHVHLHGHGDELGCVNLSRCASREECLELVAAAAESAPPGEWVRLVAARVEGWREPTWPTAQELDDAADGRPCVVRSFDYHAVVAGGAALGAAGISRTTADPARGVIERDAATGEPTGLLLEDACAMVFAAMPAATMERRRENLRRAVKDFVRRGFVEVHDMLSEPWLGPTLAEMDDAGELGLMVRLYAPFAEIKREIERAAWCSRDRVRLAGAKLFADGTLNSRTALMLEPYADPLPGFPRGRAMLTEVELLDAVRRCDALGVPAAIHAIGDGAVRNVLDAIEGARVKTKGFRIEHCEFVDEADVGRFARLGVVASVQPCHLLADIEALRRLTPRRMDRAFPLRDLIDGARDAGREAAELVWFGSDAPVVAPDARDNVRAAVERRREGMGEEEAVAPGQAISVEETVVCMRVVP